MTTAADYYKMSNDAQLDHINEQLIGMAETLVYWLNDNYSYSSVSIFFLCGVVRALIDEGWPHGAARPQVYADVMAAIDRLGAELGPMIATVEREGLPALKEDERPVPQASALRQKKDRKKTIN